MHAKVRAGTIVPLERGAVEDHRYGMIVWVAPAEYERAADALGA